MNRPDQVTKFCEVQHCTRCFSKVLHRQVVRYAKPSGFKTYDWEPLAHRRGDGSTCHAPVEQNR